MSVDCPIPAFLYVCLCVCLFSVLLSLQSGFQEQALQGTARHAVLSLCIWDSQQHSINWANSFWKDKLAHNGAHSSLAPDGQLFLPHALLNLFTLKTRSYPDTFVSSQCHSRYKSFRNETGCKIVPFIPVAALCLPVL